MFCALVLAVFCVSDATSAPQDSNATILQPIAGDPLPGLSPEELARFESGLLAYSTPLTIEQGLGPIYNKRFCGACHSQPLGGAGVITVINFGRFENNTFDPMEHLGGPVLQSEVIPGVDLACGPEDVPPLTNVVSPRLTLGTLGYGLIEAIPEEEIIAGADPEDLNGDQLRGIARMVMAREDVGLPGAVEKVGRFGWKAQAPTVLTFSIGASKEELGLTSPFMPLESLPNGPDGPNFACDTVPDPEVPDPRTNPDSFLAQVNDFQRFMAAPPQTPPSGMSGEQLFIDIGCAGCHRPSWVTSDDPDLEDALRNKTIKPYTDLLLHEMGSRLRDRIIDGVATDRHFRTPALWNLRNRTRLLHDGRAASASFSDRIIEVINDHRGESNGSRRRFDQLDPQDQVEIIDFLGSLGRREFDMDGDNDLDSSDLALALECLGSSVTPNDPCAVADIDLDGVISLSDINALREALPFDIDCNGNDIPDFWDILQGDALDCNENGVPDSCDLDGPGGDKGDKNGNGIPDSCDLARGDLNLDGCIDGADLSFLLSLWGLPNPPIGDLNGDGVVNGADLATMLAEWDGCG